ncbi:GNAT family N-acetyltransferase [Sneathiella aquimaris]|uniref:GNAT family N-acetyltransferase n=1 Tax=Sneathiella aquimaris TaxID=2599305 RepID=UPI00146E98FE|nr:GNAT family N-acetyltransferase [Sneathiella aquimaris]
MISVSIRTDDFNRWQDLLTLIQKSYAYMATRIDPPSSMHRLTAESLEAKSRTETLFIAFEESRLVGCVFLKEEATNFYLGKLAVDPDLQGKGIGSMLITACIEFAQQAGKPDIELEVRIELTENQALFSRLGFTKTGENSHAGYNRATSIVMLRKGTV